MIVQERLARNYDAVRKFQKSFWGYLRMGEYRCSLFYFGSRKKLMRILCIENTCEV